MRSPLCVNTDVYFNVRIDLFKKNTYDKIVNADQTQIQYREYTFLIVIQA